MCSVTQSCLTLCDCSPPGFSVYGILQAGILEWVAIFFSRWSSWPRDWTQVSSIVAGFFIVWVCYITLSRQHITDTYSNQCYPNAHNLYYSYRIWSAFMLQTKLRHTEPFLCFGGGFFWLYSAACEILVLWPGFESGPQQWKCQVLTTGPPGNSWTLSVFKALC